MENFTEITKVYILESPSFDEILKIEKRGFALNCPSV
jgi:hypothetical protein